MIVRKCPKATLCLVLAGRNGAVALPELCCKPPSPPLDQTWALEVQVHLNLTHGIATMASTIAELAPRLQFLLDDSGLGGFIVPGTQITSTKTRYGGQAYVRMTDFNKVNEAVQAIRSNLPTIVFNAQGLRIIPELSTIKMSDYAGNTVTITCSGMDGSDAEQSLCVPDRSTSSSVSGQISPPPG